MTSYRLEGFPQAPPDLKIGIVVRQPRVATEPVTTLNVHQLRHVTCLHIRNHNLTDAALAELRQHRNLKELHLNSAAVTDVGIVHLSDFSNLRYLNLKQSPVTEVAVTKLAAALPKCRIEWNGGVIEPK